MKKLLIAVAGLFLLALPSISFAGVENSPHDMLNVGHSGAGTVTEELCFACHIPHGALGENLWAMDTASVQSGLGTVEMLCYSCHDGSIGTLYDVFDKGDGLVDHTMIGPECSGDGACHDVHNQPAADGHFLAEGIGASGSGCENCHDNTLFTGAPAGDHTAAGNHKIGADANNLACEDCHSAHMGETQGDGTNDANILRADNEPTGGAYGAMCVACHNNQSPFGGYVVEVWDYEETVITGLEEKHPTYTAATYTLTGCNECHDVHGAVDSLLINVAHHNTAGRDMCLDCHAGDGVGAPGVGAGTHFVGDIGGITPTWAGNQVPASTPWAAEIDDDGNSGSDWASATGEFMVCETCHSVHKSGVAGNFLRIADAVAGDNELCSGSCHDAN